jgi:hypothetical protein
MVAGWSQLVLQRTLDDAQLIGCWWRWPRRAAPRPPRELTADLHGRRLTFDQLAAVLGLDARALDGPFDPAALASPGSQARRALAQPMMRVAMLHTDVAFASSELAAPPGNPRFTAMAVQLRDGLETSVPNLSVHYAIAREAIAMVLSASTGTMAARQWYYGTLAFLQNDRNYAALLPHVETARAVMPADVRVWLASGMAYENLAAPVVQVAVGSASTARIEPPAILLARAGMMLRRGLALDPTAAEAQLRLGRVLISRATTRRRPPCWRPSHIWRPTSVLRRVVRRPCGRSGRQRRRCAARLRTGDGVVPQAQSPRARPDGVAQREPGTGAVWRARPVRHRRRQSRFGSLVDLRRVPRDGVAGTGGRYAAGGTGGRRSEMSLARRSVTVALTAAAVLAADVLVVGAQQRLPPVFTSRSDVVRLDILVTTGGKPVLGLDAGDFQILDNGAPRRLISSVSTSCR